MLILQLSITYYYFKKRAAMRASGEILEDELSQIIKHRAGYRTSWISWFTWITIFAMDSLGVFNDGEIRMNWVMWSGIMLMWFVYNTNLFLLKRDK